MPISIEVLSNFWNIVGDFDFQDHFPKIQINLMRKQLEEHMRKLNISDQKIQNTIVGKMLATQLTILLKQPLMPEQEQIFKAIKDDLETGSKELIGLINEEENIDNIIFTLESRQTNPGMRKLAPTMQTGATKDEVHQTAPDIIMMLIEAIQAEDINAVNSIAIQLDEKKFNEITSNCFQIAIGDNNASVVKFLLEQLKVDVNVFSDLDESETPLTLAIDKGHKKIVEILLQHKANVNQANRYEEDSTPFMNALRKRHMDITNLLLQERGLNIKKELVNIKKKIAELKKTIEFSKDTTFITNVTEYIAELNTIDSLLESIRKKRAEEANNSSVSKSKFFSKTSQLPESTETLVSDTKNSTHSELPDEQKGMHSSTSKKDKKPHSST